MLFKIVYDIQMHGYATSILYGRVIGLNTGLEDNFCKNYIKLYKIKKIKKLGGHQIKLN